MAAWLGRGVRVKEYLVELIFFFFFNWFVYFLASYVPVSTQETRIVGGPE